MIENLPKKVSLFLVFSAFNCEKSQYLRVSISWWLRVSASQSPVSQSLLILVSQSFSVSVSQKIRV